VKPQEQTLKDQLIELVQLGKEHELLKAIVFIQDFIQKQEAIDKKKEGKAGV
jgi:hypothetical protein